LPDSEKIAEHSAHSRAQDQSAVEPETQLSRCERLVDELLKPNPDETIVLPLLKALEIPRSSIAVDRISQVFEKLEWLAKKQTRPEKDAHDL